LHVWSSELVASSETLWLDQQPWLFNYSGVPLRRCDFLDRPSASRRLNSGGFIMELTEMAFAVSALLNRRKPIHLTWWWRDVAKYIAQLPYSSNNSGAQFSWFLEELHTESVMVGGGLNHLAFFAPISFGWL
jgi:hypothetical protein